MDIKRGMEAKNVFRGRTRAKPANNNNNNNNKNIRVHFFFSASFAWSCRTICARAT